MNYQPKPVENDEKKQGVIGHVDRPSRSGKALLVALIAMYQSTVGQPGYPAAPEVDDILAGLTIDPPRYDEPGWRERKKGRP